eukprot:scaffold8301_cov184-Cylindrotheca_fusiformis.AAC.3
MSTIPAIGTTSASTSPKPDKTEWEYSIAARVCFKGCTCGFLGRHHERKSGVCAERTKRGPLWHWILYEHRSALLTCVPKAQYKCTDLGDISDEGKSRKISTEEIGTMEALLGKMGVADAVNKEKQDLPGTLEGKRGDSKEESRL